MTRVCDPSAPTICMARGKWAAEKPAGSRSGARSSAGARPGSGLPARPRRPKLRWSARGTPSRQAASALPPTRRRTRVKQLDRDVVSGPHLGYVVQQLVPAFLGCWWTMWGRCLFVFFATQPFSREADHRTIGPDKWSGYRPKTANAASQSPDQAPEARCSFHQRQRCKRLRAQSRMESAFLFISVSDVHLSEPDRLRLWKGHQLRDNPRRAGHSSWTTQPGRSDFVARV